MPPLNFHLGDAPLFVFLQAVAAYANFPVIPHFKKISVVVALKITLLIWCAQLFQEPPERPPQAFKYQLESLLQSSAADKSSKIASSVNTKDLFDIANNQDVLLSDCYLVSTMFFLFALETVKGELTICCNQPGQGAFGIHSPFKAMLRCDRKQIWLSLPVLKNKLTSALASIY